MTHGKTYNKSPRRINHKATKSKTNTGTTALERSVESCHPKACKVNIPFCLASKVITIVSDESQQEVRLNQLKGFIKQQDYPDGLIINCRQRAIKKGPTTGDGRRYTLMLYPRYVTTFNPCNTNVQRLCGIVKKSYGELSE